MKYYVDLHVVVDGRISVTDGHRIGHEVEAAIEALAWGLVALLIAVFPANIHNGELEEACGALM